MIGTLDMYRLFVCVCSSSPYYAAIGVFNFCNRKSFRQIQYNSLLCKMICAIPSTRIPSQMNSSYTSRQFSNFGKSLWANWSGDMFRCLAKQTTFMSFSEMISSVAYACNIWFTTWVFVAPSHYYMLQCNNITSNGRMPQKSGCGLLDEVWKQPYWGLLGILLTLHPF